MLLEKQNNTRNEDIVGLTNDYIKANYKQKGDINCNEAILIKNKIVVLLGKIYKDIVDSFFAGNINKEKVFEFISAVSNLMGAGIINAKNEIFNQLVEKNQALAKDEKQLKVVRDYINSEIDKKLSGARIEIDSVIDIFRQKCIEILLEKGQNVTNMLKMSHGRDKTKIGELKQQNTGLENQVGELQETVEKQSKTLRKGFVEWGKLNNKVLELEDERRKIEGLISSIEKELEGKKRRLKGTTTSEKLDGILRFTREIQSQETYWQKSIVNQQHFDRIETNLRNEINDLYKSLMSAKEIAVELNDELIEEQRKNKILTTSDEKIIFEGITKQLMDYFCLLFESDDFINQTKQEEFELTIKMTYYRAKVLNINIYDFVIEQLNKIETTYKERYKDKFEKVEFSIGNLKNFINSLQYGNNYIEKAIKVYSDILDT
ncbi:MAG: hypothetical protein PHH98_00730 [Candidatus Gracilibacteria bacterium]|nr:hypothetical protein [Candidatus Gracilibacteria bacterium]